MDDLEKNEDLSKFTEEEDSVKPIETKDEPKAPQFLPEDMGMPAGSEQADPTTPPTPPPTPDADNAAVTDATPAEPETGGAPPFLDEDVVDVSPPIAFEAPSVDDGRPPLPGAEASAPPASEEPSGPIDFLQDAEDSPPPPPRKEKPVGYFDEEKLFLVKKGETINLSEKDPTMNRITVAAGWDQRAFEEKAVDVDLSLFLLNKDGKTRNDDDFVFFNQERGCEGAVRHLEDSRTGAGEGDDEMMEIDLNGLPFDIMEIMFVLSVYMEDEPKHNFGKVKNIYIRVVNSDDDFEICRFRIEEGDAPNGLGMYIAKMTREGAIWHFSSLGEIEPKGLPEIADKFGIIVKEMQSTA